MGWHGGGVAWHVKNREMSAEEARAAWDEWHETHPEHKMHLPGDELRLPVPTGPVLTLQRKREVTQALSSSSQVGNPEEAQQALAQRPSLKAAAAHAGDGATYREDVVGMVVPSPHPLREGCVHGRRLRRST